MLDVVRPYFRCQSFKLVVTIRVMSLHGKDLQSLFILFQLQSICATPTKGSCRAKNACSVRVSYSDGSGLAPARFRWFIFGSYIKQNKRYKLDRTLQMHHYVLWQYVYKI